MSGDARLEMEARVVRGDDTHPRLDVAITVPAGITVVCGPSGAGKTTLLLCIAGLVRPAEGRIALTDGPQTDVWFDAGARAFVAPHRRRAALVFQSLALFPHMSALDNVSYGVPRASRAERVARAHEWLARAHVGHLALRRPQTLSGGEAQRVALARALASEPRVLCLDEPFSALDAALRQELSAELRALVAELKLPTLFVTHDRQDAQSIADRRLELADGRLRG